MLKTAGSLKDTGTMFSRGGGGGNDVKPVSLNWRILLKDAVKIGAADKQADHKRVTSRWRSADCVQRLWHHARDTRVAVAVRSKIAYCPTEAIKLTEKKLKYAVFIYRYS
jgi:hypothetical protein